MYIQRFSYWPRADRFPREFSRVFSHLFDVDDGDLSDVVTSQWSPRVDIREEDKRFVIEADIPGVDPKDIEIDMDKGVLSIRGERRSGSKTEQGDGTRKYTCAERSHGVFHRHFALPDSTNPDAISATGGNGVLEIEIPKRPETTPRKIEIKTGA